MLGGYASLPQVQNPGQAKTEGVPPGKMSSYLFGLKQGDKVTTTSLARR